MTDLTKLTAEELLRRVIFEDDNDAVNETALRLERLEKCEALIEEQDKLLAAYRTGSNRMAGRAIDRIHELRAALEGK